MVTDRSRIGLQEKSVAAVYKKTRHEHLRLIIDHQDSSHKNSPRASVALIVDRIADHGQKEVNLKTIKAVSYTHLTLPTTERV